MNNNKTGKSLIALMVLAVAFLWGFSFIFSKVLLRSLEPVRLLAARWTLAALFFLVLIIGGKLRIHVRRSGFFNLVIVALIEPCAYSVFETYGLKFTSASVSSIFIAVIPCAVLLSQMLFFHRKPDISVIAGILIAFCGVIVCTVFSPDFHSGGTFYGYLCMMGAVVCGAAYASFAARAGQTHSEMEITACMAFGGAVFFNLLNFGGGYGAKTYTLYFSSGFVDGKALICLLILGLGCSSLCYIIANRLIREISPTIANNLIGNSVTVIGVLAGVLLLGESAGLYTIIGLTLTIGGVLLSAHKL